MRHNIRDSKGRFAKACKEPERVYMRGFKGFNKGLKCRDKQYKENTVFEEPKARMCKKGMHFCGNPLDVLEYYPPWCGVEYCEVEALAPCTTGGNKSVTTKLRVLNKLSVEDFCREAVDYAKCCKSDVNEINATRYSIASNTKNRSVTSSEGSSSIAANVGDRAVTYAIERYSIAANIGGYSMVSSTGRFSAAVSIGMYSRVSTTGINSTAVALDYGSCAEVEGKNSVAVALGPCSKVKGILGCFLVCVGEDQKLAGGLVDGIKIKPDTWYEAKGGKLVEVGNG